MDHSRAFFDRLEALNGGPLRRPASERDVPPDKDEIRRILRARRETAPTEGQPDAIVYRRDLPVGTPAPAPTALPGHVVRLEEAVAGVEEAVADYGCAFHVAAALHELDGDWTVVRELFPRAFHAASPLHRRLALRVCAETFEPEDVLFVDVETTGLGHSPLFLIGTLAWEGDDLVVRQFLARHYGEEAAVTALFVNRAREKRLLVSFNGKSFDAPYIRARAAATGVPCPPALPHFDLLHESRRIWKTVVPNCKLQTLERHICGRLRQGDIPGADIPQAYHDYVRTSNAAQIVQVLHHNMLDLITLAELITRLPQLACAGTDG